MKQPILGAIFDLDGTLVDSQLDFDAVRLEVGLPAGQSVLEAMECMDSQRREHCRQVLHRHELAGAERATPVPGAADFIRLLRQQQIMTAVVTRNSKPMAHKMLSRFSLHFDTVISREDGPVKPDPWAIHSICENWNVSTERVVMVGDYRFDIQCGQRAGCRTVLVTHCRGGAQDECYQADFLLRSFEQSAELISWLGL